MTEPLHDVDFFSFPLSFWIAQNGAISVFVALIFIYAKRMGHLDHQFNVHDEDLDASEGSIPLRSAEPTGPVTFLQR